MANKLYEEDSVSAIATAIRNKNGTSDTYTVAEMAPAIDALSSNVVNGIIKQYKASSTTVSANTFVEFVNDGDFGTGIGDNTELVSVGGDAELYAVMVEQDKAIVFYVASSKLCGVVCTISGTTITAGAETQLSNQFYGRISAANIGQNKIFVAHSDSSYSSPESGDNQLYGIVCAVSGTTIMAGTETQLATCGRSGQDISVVALEEDKVLITHMKGCLGIGYKTVTLESVVCTVSGSTITTGTPTTLSSSASINPRNSIAVIDTNKVFISFCEKPDGTNNLLYGIVGTVSGDTITYGTKTQLSSVNGSGYSTSVAAMSTSDKVFVSFSKNNKLYGIVCTVSGTTITAGTEAQLSTSSASNYTNPTSTALVDANTVFVSYVKSNNAYGVTCSVSGTTISVNSDVKITATNNIYAKGMGILVSNEKILYVSRKTSSTYSIYGTIVTRGQSIIPSSTKIEGLTKTECTTSAAGDVWVLNQGS